MLGEVAMYCFVVLVVTGVYLTFFFVPSDKTVIYHGSYAPLRGVAMSQAYESTVRLSFDVRAGLVMRQIHHWAALVFIATIVAHLCRIFFTGAFRRPRELNWIIGVTLLVLAIFNGFAGYSLPDDLLSGTGLRIAYSIALADPARRDVVGVPGLRRRVPGRATSSTRLFVIHVLHHPGRDRRAARRAPRHALAAEAHAVPRARAAREDNVVGSRLWPTYTAKSIGLFAVIAGVLALLGGLAQINPIWLYGPFDPSAVSTAAQPDWYLGWIEGALRLMPPVYLHIGPYNVSELFWPAIAAAGHHVRAAVPVAVPRAAGHPRSRASTTCSTGRATGRCAPHSASACSPSTRCCSSPARRTSGRRSSTSPHRGAVDVPGAGVRAAGRLRRVHLEVLPRPRTPPARGAGRGRRRTADRAERAAAGRRLPTDAGTGTGTGTEPAEPVRPAAAHRVRGRHPLRAAPRRGRRGRATLSDVDPGFTGPDDRVRAPRWTNRELAAPGDRLSRLVEQLGEQSALDGMAGALRERIAGVIRSGPVKDALSGTWLGHAVHPMLTDLPIGFWTSAFTLDLLGGRHSRRAATRLIGGACSWRCRPWPPACPTGRTRRDRTGASASCTRRPTRPRCVCYDASWVERKRGRHWRAWLDSSAASPATVGGYLGGHLLGAPGSASTTPRSGTRHLSGRR